MGIYRGLIVCWYLYPYSVKQQDPISKNYTTCSMLSWITIGNFVEVLEKLEWSFHDKLIRVEISKTTQILPFNWKTQYFASIVKMLKYCTAGSWMLKTY